MNDYEGDWALFEELGSRVMADLYVENSPRLGEPAIRTRAFAAEGIKVTSLSGIKGLYFGLECDDADALGMDEDERKELELERERVYEIEDVDADGKLRARIIWPDTKAVDPKSGSLWIVRPDLVDWIYDPNETATSPTGWREEWNKLQQSTATRYGIELTN